MKRHEADVYDPAVPLELDAPAAQVVAALRGHVTAERIARINAVIRRRTRRVIPVLEEITDPHNASAVLRTADAMGVQEIHVISGERSFLAAERVAKGSHKWLTLVRHHTPVECAAALHARGYTILVATMNGELGPAALGAMERVAVVFGNEHRGVSAAMREHADGTYAIPMHGFVESLNVSVAAAITLYAATHGRPPELTEGEQELLRAQFLMHCVRDAHDVVRAHVES